MEDIHQGWLDMSTTKSKNWLKKSVTKPWKKRFFVLQRDEVNRDRVFLTAYEKEENVTKQKPKHVLDLFPKFKVAKTNELKGKEFTFQVSNETESWFLAAKNQKLLDLWVLQIQMQTKLSRSLSGRVFYVKAANTKQLQRIGAKDQACLLHITRWGLTLALQDSRSVLALWPLDTIRNYECTGTQQFIFEAGRRSPMGEGKYAFFTQEGEDEVIFKVIDIFVSARLESKADLTPSRKREEVTDDDILLAYDKLHSCVLGNPPPEVFDDPAVCSTLDSRGSSLPMRMEPPPSYDHLSRTGAIHSISDDMESCPSTPYDQLDRSFSWGRRGFTKDAGYTVIDEPKGNSFSNTYDHLNRVVPGQRVVDSGPYNHFGSFSDSSSYRSPGGYPISRHEPSVPNILSADDHHFLGERCGSLTSNSSDITYSNTSSPSEMEPYHSRKSSTSSTRKQRGTGERFVLSTSLKDDPPALPSPRSPISNTVVQKTKPVPQPGDHLPTNKLSKQESMYQNSEF